MKKIFFFFFFNLLFFALDVIIYRGLKKESETIKALPWQMPPVIEPIKEEPKMTQEEAQAFLVDLIKQREGFQPRPYLCPAGVLTIGYGFTQKKHLAKGYMTEKEATRILVQEIIPAAKKKVHQFVKVPLTAYQEAALVSFVYNCGEANLARLVNGKNRLNGGNYERTAALLMLYTKADGKTLRGLVERRKQEANLFLGKM